MSGNAEESTDFDAMGQLNLPAIKAFIREGLRRHGTNLAQNDREPYGDGDQSAVRNKDDRQFYRDLFAIGGDLNQLVDVQLSPLSEFARLCLTGQVKAVEEKLKALDDPKGPIPLKLTQLLEFRESSLRLPPLLLMTSLAKNIELPIRSLHDQVVDLLLQYGARPDALDVGGKTVVHYGSGVMATNYSISVADKCIEAYKSQHMFNERVVLHGLQNKKMNGQFGLCKGFVPSTGRRAVLIDGKENVVGIKPENLRLLEENSSASEGDDDRGRIPNLCDVPDRLGAVVLQELLMGDRIDVTQHLLGEHRPRVDISDWDGYSPESIAATQAQTETARVILKYARKRSKQEERKQQDVCQACGKTNKDLLVCSSCQQASYCNRDCQVKHWKIHKPICKQLQVASQGVELEEPWAHDDGEPSLHTALFNYRTGKSSQNSSTKFNRPKGVEPDEAFIIKVQAGGATPMQAAAAATGFPLLIYDKSRTCEFFYSSKCKNHGVLEAAVREESRTSGLKMYVQAKVDRQGIFRVYLNTKCIKRW